MAEAQEADQTAEMEVEPTAAMEAVRMAVLQVAEAGAAKTAQARMGTTPQPRSSDTHHTRVSQSHTRTPLPGTQRGSTCQRNRSIHTGQPRHMPANRNCSRWTHLAVAGCQEVAPMEVA